MLRGVFLIHAWALHKEDVEHEAWDQAGKPHYMVYHASRRLLLALPQVLVLHDRDVQDPIAFVQTQLRVAPVGLQVHGTSECVLGCSLPAHCFLTHACCWQVSERPGSYAVYVRQLYMRPHGQMNHELRLSSTTWPCAPWMDPFWK